MADADAPTTELPAFPPIADFLFNVPLYAEYRLGAGSPTVFQDESVGIIYGLTKHTVDGHCPYCHKQSTFSISGADRPMGEAWQKLPLRHAHEIMSIQCARNSAHKIYFTLRIINLRIQKIGQYPSLADIANDESKSYRSVLTRNDSLEFHKAIGLAAHGVGIGSFVYLRRIFERLIFGTFEDNKPSLSLNETDFNKLRVEEKVETLKDYLPKFMVENKRVYSILSVGIHELSEDQCLSAFDLMKQSIILILDDHKRAKEEAASRKAFGTAI